MASPSVDQIDVEQLRISVQKNSNERLRHELKTCQSAISAEDVEKLSRSELVANVVKLRCCAGQTTVVKHLVTNFIPAVGDDIVPLTTPTETQAPVQFVSTDSLAQLITALQLQSQLQMQAQQDMLDKRLKAEKELAEQRLHPEIEQRRLELEQNEKRIHAAEKRTNDVTTLLINKHTEETDIMKEQLKLTKDAATERETERNKYENRFERAQRILKSALYPMPLQSAEVQSWMLEMEALFQSNNIEQDLRTALLRPHVNHRVRRVLRNMPATEVIDFDVFKELVRREFNLILSTHKYNWDNSKRTSEDSPKVYMTQLQVCCRPT